MDDSTIEINPNDPPGVRAAKLSYIGSQFHIQGNLDAARLHYDAALLLNPDEPTALQNLSGALFSVQQDWAALSVAQRAMNAAPNNPYAKANHAAALMHLGRYEQAIREMKEVLSVVKNADGILHNLALSFYMNGQIGPAIVQIKKSLEINPNVTERIADLGIFTLASGDLASGLEIYEERWKTLFHCEAWNLGIPEWKGENPKGKRLLLHHEQGFGDGIMLVRFVKILRERGVEVVIAAPKDLMRLFVHNFPDCRVVDWKGDPKEWEVENFDFHSPMLSAFRWLGLSPDEVESGPYLNAPQFESFLGAPGFRVGICWESGDHGWHFTRRRRVVPLELFFPLAELPGVRLVSLQKGEGTKDILNLGAESFILDPMARVEDFFDTAQIIQALDLVIGVDSAVVHLAGSLGKPTLMLGPFTRCWRWWGETDGEPWYENFRIFPQERPGDWKGAMHGVVKFVRERLRDVRPRRAA